MELESGGDPGGIGGRNRHVGAGIYFSAAEGRIRSVGGSTSSTATEDRSRPNG